MSCDSWLDSALRPGAVTHLDGPRRAELIAHLRACLPCRRRALDIEPSLAFSLLVAPEIERDEVNEIRRTVRAMRRLRGLVGTASAPRHRSQMTAAAVLMLAGALLLLPGGAGRRLDVSTPGAEVTAPPALFQGAPRLALDRPTASLIEDLDRPQARVYQLTEDDLSLVMIVDETLDL